jgi:hypothetical protein
MTQTREAELFTAIYSEMSGQAAITGDVIHDGSVVATLAWWNNPDGTRRAYVDDGVITAHRDGRVTVVYRRDGVTHTEDHDDVAEAITRIGLGTLRCDGLEGYRGLPEGAVV